MKQDRIFTFTVDKENWSVRIERSFRAPIGLVWSAWTEAEILDRWWGPKPYRAETRSMDFSEGGRWLYSMVGPEGDRHWGLKKFLRIVPRESLTYQSVFCDEHGQVAPAATSSTWVNTFVERDGVTLVTNDIRCDSLEHLEAQIRMGFAEGYTVCLEQLDEWLALAGDGRRSSVHHPRTSAKEESAS